MRELRAVSPAPGQVLGARAENRRAMQYEMLKRSADFKRLRGGTRWVSPLFVIEARPRLPDGGAKSAVDSGGLVEVGPFRPRFGLTITRKIGNAVVRNKIRRRIKEALRSLQADGADPPYDHVIIPRVLAASHPFDELKHELETGLQRVHQPPKPSSPDRPRRQRANPQAR